MVQKQEAHGQAQFRRDPGVLQVLVAQQLHGPPKQDSNGDGGIYWSVLRQVLH